MLHRVELRLFECILMQELRLKCKPNVRLSRSVKFDGDPCFGLYEGEYMGRGKYVHTIRINKSAVTDSLSFFATLAHEYVHAWQMENEHDVDHGKNFDAWCKQFAKDYCIDINNMV